jgi:hypothetical protein
MGNVTIQGDLTGASLGGYIGGALNLTTAGAIPYVSAAGILNQDPTALFWDAANDRLGIGTNAPVSRLHVSGLALIGSTSPVVDSFSSLVVSQRSSLDGFSTIKMSPISSSARGWTVDVFDNGTSSQYFQIFDSTNSAIRMRIANTGNLLIGTTTDSNFKLDVATSGSAGTARFYDQTATTGSTKVVVRAGAGQSATNLQEWQDSAGTVQSRVTGGAIESVNYLATQISAFGGYRVVAYNNKLSLGSLVPINWSITNDASAASDLSLSRASAGVLQVGDGAANANGKISAGQSTFQEVRIGKGAGAGNTNSTAVGVDALASNSSGINNSAFGNTSLGSNSSGQSNSSFGTFNLLFNSSGSWNSSIGHNALRENTTGSNNTSIGFRAGYTATAANANTTGSNNTWIGSDSGPASTTQRTNSVAIGYQALVNADNSGVLGTAGMKWSVGGQTVPSSILHVEDTTATTGATKLVVKAGAGQSTTNLQEWQNSSGTNLANIDSGGNIFGNQVLDNSNAGRINSGGFYAASNKPYGFSSTTSSGGTPDLGIYRNAAGVLEVNNGTAGTYRDLILRRSQHNGVTVADLPAMPNAAFAGSIQYVTDANATTIGSTVAGGGANKVMVWSDGAAWKIFAS